MTQDEILALDGREFNEQMARFVGMRVGSMRRSWYRRDYISPVFIASDGTVYDEVPNFENDRNAAALVLAEVERRGNEYALVRALRVVEPSLPDVGLEYGEIQVWQVLRLTPKQLCQAALLACMDTDAARKAGE